MLKQSINYVAVGLEMGIAVVIGIVGGKWADSYFNTTPVLFWVGLGIGFGAAAKAVVDAAQKARKELEEDGPQDTKED